MTRLKNVTKKQHYIPRMLLKHFTTFYIPLKKPLIYQYDKIKCIERLVDINDICCKNYLYEIRDESGVISKNEINLIENAFSCFESAWNKIIDKIIIKENITQEDRCLLGVLLVSQLLRTPEVMKFTSDWLYDTAPYIYKQITRNEADKYMKLSSFIFDKFTPETNFILNILIQNILVNRDIVIFHSDYGFILNEQRPVLCLNLFEDCSIKDCLWLLPITKNHCVAAINGNAVSDVDINKNLTRFINLRNFQNDGRFVYGSKSFFEKIQK